MPDSSLLEVTITSLGGLGDGIADIGGKPVFIPKSCTGDRLRIHITKETVQDMRGQIIDILSPGTERASAPCIYFADCGGCSLQHLTPKGYTDFKRGVFHSALRQAGFDLPDAKLIFIRPDARRRVELRVTRGEKGISLAYFRPGTNILLPIDNCLILEPVLQAFITPFTQALSAWPDAEHIYFVRLTATDAGVDLVFSMKQKVDTSPLTAMAEALDIARISVSAPQDKTRVVCERRPVDIAMGKHQIPFLPDAFLQATSEGQEILIKSVCEAVKPGAKVADLFCGIGPYSFPLSDKAHVHAVEIDSAMTGHVKSCARKLGLDKKITTERRDLFKTPLTAAELKRFDTVVINPPRPGAKAQCQQLAASTVKRVVMVSCNPASFARDAKILSSAGFTLKSALGIDQFVYSPHFEIVAVFQR